ncbi:2-keto-3-deoxygluconate transporter [Azospirillum brasilense]|uniref:2-keto-3-deoxygluconate permease n=1 Tax=Azospirillum brasilense TaxID=192 RepID=A0A0N7I942_AZOBR|nr:MULTISPECIES: 2-keto-3-deoxygluconate transporter [Azospirillum]ALJ39043.1 2-keto-3-deoxygluconate permease [Azospirillum brasilense]MDW7557242.1 2-keto-3-deoxygluconate transporter [Azospirillum brasilense]MDW7596244.1 2-keto-3-deoxygluconate transporter [Azospirillum brasilense]MDW7628386.1 2-keto-3-deoxygluconate transporter [Azospirillum brasilense]MDX5950541.1 2-keto-3-deoxygluconate transporter [Azospirillum brasilense]
MNIKSRIDRIPGGMMILPLFLGACLNTFAPNTGKFFGSFTNGLITGTLPILSVWFFCIGASISLKATPLVLRKSGVLVTVKILTAATMGIVASWFIPHEGVSSGFFTGLSVLAIIAAMNDTNGGMYMALMQQYGTKEESGAFCLMCLESGPFMTMATLGLAGLAAFPWQTMVGALLPFLIGFALGNLDQEFRKFFGQAVPVMVPFFAFALGNNLNFAVILNTGLLGIVLGLSVIAITGFTLVVADVLLAKGNGTAGIGAASTAGAAVTVPPIIASIEPSFAPSAPAATALVATSVVVTSLLTPILTAWWARRFGVLSPRYLAAQKAAQENTEAQPLPVQPAPAE